jgi:hypothetical protein
MFVFLALNFAVCTAEENEIGAVNITKWSRTVVRLPGMV